MTSMAEEIARRHVDTREGRRLAESRALNALPPAVGTARVDEDARNSLVGRAGMLTRGQAVRTSDGRSA